MGVVTSDLSFQNACAMTWLSHALCETGVGFLFF